MTESKFKIGDYGYFVDSANNFIKEEITGIQTNNWRGKITHVYQLGLREESPGFYGKYLYVKNSDDVYTKQELLKMIEEL